MAETLRKQVKRLEEDVNYWKDRCAEAEGKLDEIEEEKRLNRMISDKKEEIRKADIQEENRKLWYLVRTLIGDPNMKPIIEKTIDGPGFSIDLFTGEYHPINQLRY